MDKWKLKNKVEDDERKPLLSKKKISNVNNGLSSSTLSVQFASPLPYSKYRLLKNLSTVSFAFCLFFTGFQTLSNLQSTINAESGLGMDTQALIAGFTMFSAVFIPKTVVDYLGCKISMIVSLSLCIPFIAANFYSSWQTLIPTAVVFGIASGPMITAQCIYIKEIAFLYTNYASDNFDIIASKFFGVYSFFTENTQIWGNLLSYYILKPHMNHNHTSHYIAPKCGINFKPHVHLNGSNTSYLIHEMPTDDGKNLLVGIFVAFSIIAVFIMSFLVDSLRTADTLAEGTSTESNSSNSSYLFSSTLAQLTDPHQLCLVPITTYVGYEIAFYTGEFTQAYIACSWGIYHVGFVTICFGAFGALTSIMMGFMVKHLGQTTVITLGAIIHGATYTFIYMWDSGDSDIIYFFIVASAWGTADAIMWSQIPAVYGLLFPNSEEAAFANFCFWSSFGSFLSYSCSTSLSITIKVYLLMTFLASGIICYFIGQIKLCYSRRLSLSTVANDREIV